MKQKKILVSLITSATIVSSLSYFSLNKDIFVPFYYDTSSSLALSSECEVIYDDSLLLNDFDDSYKTFLDYLVDSSVEVPFFERMVPQGLAVLDNYTFISMYDFDKEQNSVICVLENGELVNVCSLPNRAHVGGIAVDKTNNLLWVSSTLGMIDGYSLEDVIGSKQLELSYIRFDVGENLSDYKRPWVNSVSFLTINDDILYVGSFSLHSKGLVKMYDISSVDNEISLNYIDFFEVPDKVQGIDFYENGTTRYLILSRSFGSMPSILQFFEYNDGVNLDSSSNFYLVMPSMVEQITVCDDSLMAVFESGAEPYLREDKVDNICVLDCKRLIKSLEQNKDAK